MFEPVYGDDGTLRDYGYGIGGVPDGIPRWKLADAKLPPCPNCGAKVCEIEVKMKDVPLLKGGVGMTRYFGCPACPWASPAITTTINEDQKEGQDD